MFSSWSYFLPFCILFYNPISESGITVGLSNTFGVERDDIAILVSHGRCFNQDLALDKSLCSIHQHFSTF